ncbi:MAG TPA: tetratricopeptide repeat protein [Anaerolineales bacterium]|nr:tetratricopeptide repeat protein [Anaerolineales bacterium]
MPPSDSAISLDSFITFGDLLKYLRRRARLTQRELSIAVGYSEAQISRLEQNLRPPDLAALTALFISALYLEDEPELVARLLDLAAQARGEEPPRSGVVTFTRSVRQEVLENVRSVEENVLNNLPLQLTSFVGREREIRELIALFKEAKLVTLTGSGGCGKTRLALETAGRLGQAYRDGIWLVELAPILDPKLVLSAVTSKLGVPESRDIHLMNALTNYLQKRQSLIILDNCEQVVAAAAQLAGEILRVCPHLQILATSREILDISGEVQFRVPSLSVSSEHAIERNAHLPSEAEQLFVERARAVQPSFVLTDRVLPHVRQICRLVDGLPLGIELAAAKISVLSVEQIAARLHGSFQMLRGGRDSFPHHQTLEATIQWSYELLSESERVLLQRLSVFSGGWTLGAAEAVIPDEIIISREKVLDLLSQLINKSLVVAEWTLGDEARYSMLQTIHEFAARKLREAGGMEEMRSQHFNYFYSMAQDARLFGNEKGRWLERLEAEHDNLRLALAWSLETNIPEMGTAMILPILDFYWFRGFSGEARERMNAFLEIDSPASPTRALLLQKTGWLTRASGDYQKADELLRRALEMALEIGDKNRAAWALMDLSLSTREQGDNQQAINYSSLGLAYARESGETRAIGACFFNLAECHGQTGDLETSRRFWAQGLSLFRAERDQTHIAWGLEGLAGTAFLAKDYASALAFHLESLKFKAEVMDKLGIAYSFEGLAQVAAATDSPQRAAILWGAAEYLREAMNIPLESSRENIYISLQPAARAQMGNEPFDQAWKKGNTMSLEEAIRCALTPADNPSA